MSYHKAECVASDPWGRCICPELRAAEERVEESMDRAWQQTVQLAVAHTRTATLHAAREAVAAVPHGIRWGTAQHVYRERALAAIDALREER